MKLEEVPTSEEVYKIPPGKGLYPEIPPQKPLSPYPYPTPIPAGYHKFNPYYKYCPHCGRKLPHPEGHAEINETNPHQQVLNC